MVLDVLSNSHSHNNLVKTLGNLSTMPLDREKCKAAGRGVAVDEGRIGGRTWVDFTKSQD